MPDPNDRVPENVPGPWYVTTDCIACGLCEDRAPAVFKLTPGGDYNYVHHQPATPDEQEVAEEARECCPVDAIGNDG
jgi:ferredoxin